MLREMTILYVITSDPGTITLIQGVGFAIRKPGSFQSASAPVAEHRGWPLRPALVPEVTLHPPPLFPRRQHGGQTAVVTLDSSNPPLAERPLV